MTFEIATNNYTLPVVRANKNIGYVFTENTYSMTYFSKRYGGGSALIRPESNAYPIVTKKKYDYNTKENVDYVDTEENFMEFTETNTILFDRILKSEKEKIIFPKGFATDKAQMPTRFAIWLQEELLKNFGLSTELNQTKTGLFCKEIIKKEGE